MHYCTVGLVFLILSYKYSIKKLTRTIHHNQPQGHIDNPQTPALRPLL